MIKTITKFILGITLSALVVFSASARDYQKDVDYVVVTQNRTTKPEIREYFSFFCSHCFALRPSFDQIKKAFTGKAEFVDNPVGIIGAEIGVETQIAYAIALNQGIEEQLKDDLFNRIHVKEETPQDHEYFVGVFEGLGVSRDKYEQDYSSFVTQAKVAEFDRLTKEYKIEAVPEIVVNGKYLAKTDNIDTPEDYIALINYLLTLD